MALWDAIFKRNTITCGDALTVLSSWPDACVDCVVTSPPYWGLRDYGVKGQLGWEPTPAEFVARLTIIFREVRRVLTDRGTLWLNMGDSYTAGGKGGGGCFTRDRRAWDAMRSRRGWRETPKGFRRKNLLGMPWRTAFALQDDGWNLRSDIIWAKSAPAPESVCDRPTKSHEYLFLFSKSMRYHYDKNAIKVPQKEGERLRRLREMKAGKTPIFKLKRDTLTNQSVPGAHGCFRSADARHALALNGMRNKWSVWTIAPQPFRGAHFATFPEKLVEPCILAGCPAGGVVLDPFMGAGTVALVAAKLGRDYAGVELNPDYIAMANERLGQFKAAVGL